MLDQALKDQVKAIFAALDSQYELVVTASPDHSARQEMTELIADVADCSDKLTMTLLEGEGLSMTIAKDGAPSSFRFEAVPNGHEFTTLLLALLNLDGKGKNLPDEALIKRIRSFKGAATVSSYISLTCTNCPDVAQALNLVSIYNPQITHRIVDGAINEAEVKRRGVQAVPTVYINDEVLHIGKSNIAELVEKIAAKMGTEAIAEKSTYHFDVVVAGGGPAGATAAIYSARKGFKVALITDRVGGQVLETQDIENITSLTKITGTAYAAKIREHLEDYPVEIFDNRRLESASRQGDKSVVTTTIGEEFVGRSLIIATGASWRKLGVPGEADYVGRGVAFCTHCDGPFYKGKRVVVVGGGNSGLEAAIDLSGIATEITVVEFLDSLKGDQVLQEKIAAMPNVKVVLSAQTAAVNGNGEKVTGITYKDRATGEEHTIDCDGIFVQIGLLPNSTLFGELVELTPRGEIVVDANCRTSVAGIYAAGDVTTVPYKQILIAKGEGAKAALSSFEDLALK